MHTGGQKDSKGEEMKRALRFVVVFIIGLFSHFCHGQSTNVAITVISPPGQNWLNGTVSYKFKPTPNFPGNSQWQGADLPSNYLVVTTLALNGSGGASFTLPSNTAITPAGSMWTITVCANATVQCVSTDLAVAGTSQDISSAINANLNPISVQGLNVPLAYTDAEIKTTVRTGSMYINTTRNVPEWYNGTAWQDFGTGSGGANPAGPGGCLQFANVGATGFNCGALFNTDVYNTSNNGIEVAQSTLCTGNNCDLYVPANSSNTELAGPLPVLSSTQVSSELNDTRNNVNFHYYTNPGANLSTLVNLPGLGVGQNAQGAGAVFTLPTPPNVGLPQGSGQVLNLNVIVAAGGGFDIGPDGCPSGPLCGINPPLTGYPSAGAWQFTGADVYLAIFANAGIKQLSTYTVSFDGLGDSQVRAGIVSYQGGCVVLSDECFHLESDHISTHGDYIGTVDVSIDNYTIHTNATANAQTQGQEHFIFGADAVFGNVSIDGIKLPVDPNTPGAFLFNGISLPVSTTRGTAASNCVIQEQYTGVGTTTCIVNVDGAFQAHNFVPTTGNSTAVCSAYHLGNYYNIGMEVISVASGPGGGQQTLTLTARKSIPAGSVMYQGGGCNLGVKLNADDANALNFENTTVSGSVFACIGTPDIHNIYCPAYFASAQDYAVPFFPGSQAGTTEINVGHAGPGSSAFTATISRTAGLDTAILDVNNGDPRLWGGQVFFTVSGCGNDLDGVKGNPSGNPALMPGPTTNKVTYLDSGPDRTACVGAKMVPQGSLADVVDIALITSVINDAPGLDPLEAIDGTFKITYNPTLHTISRVLVSPTNYAAATSGIDLKPQIAQPQVDASGINIATSGYSAFEGSAITLSSTLRQELYRGAGGRGVPLNAITQNGLYSVGWAMEPSPTDAVYDIAGPSGLWPVVTFNPSFRDFKLFKIGTQPGEHGKYGISARADAESIGIFWDFSPVDQITLGPITNFSIPTILKQPEFLSQTAQFPTVYSPYSQIGENIVNPGESLGRGPTYQAIRPAAPVVTPSPIGTTEYAYVLLVNDDAGPTWSVPIDIKTGPATLGGGNIITISCGSLPSGKTGEIYAFITTSLETVGPCPNSATNVVDDGTHYGPPQGREALNMGKFFTSGGFAAESQGGFVFYQNDYFGTITDPTTITARFSQPSDGVISVDTGTAGNGAGTLNVFNLNVSGTCSGCGGGGGGIADIIITLPTSSVGANACTSPATATMTGLATNSAIISTFATNPNAVVGWGSTGGLVFTSWPTSNTLNWSICNQTGSPITPGAMNLNIGAR